MVTGSLLPGDPSSYPRPVPPPPDPFDPLAEILPAGFVFHRVHNIRRAGTDFNPGFGGRTRFAPFGDPVVPWLYGAETQQAAVAETILHDLDPGNSFVLPSHYRNNALSQITTTRPLRLAALHGAGGRRLRVLATDVTATDPTKYTATVKWAEAAHKTGFDGLSYMSKQCNTDRAFVLFGDRVATADLAADVEQTFAFGDYGDGFDLLVNLCAPMRIDVLTR